MKKTLLLFLFGFPVFLYGQRYPTGKGTFRSGGGMTASITDKDLYNEFKFTVTPRLGYFVSDHLLCGFSSNLTFTIDTALTTAIRFTPYLAYYYNLSPAAFLISNVQYGFDRTTAFREGGSIVDHSSFAVGPGFAYFFSRRVGFEVNFLYQQYFEPDASHQNKLVTDGGFSFNIFNVKEKIKKNRKGKYQLFEEDEKEEDEIE